MPGDRKETKEVRAAKQELHQLIDQLPNEDVEWWLRVVRDKSQMAFTVVTAPYDDEEYTEEEEALIQEGRDAAARGDLMKWEEVKRELGL